MTACGFTRYELRLISGDYQTRNGVGVSKQIADYTNFRELWKFYVPVIRA